MKVSIIIQTITIIQTASNLILCMLASLVGQLVKNQPAMQEFDPWVGKIPWRRKKLPTSVFWFRE